MTQLTNIEFATSKNKTEIVELLRKSGHFRVDNETSWAKTYYLQSSDKMFIDVLDDKIVLSENGGASVLAVICTLEVIRMADKETKLKVVFKYGNFTLNIFKHVFLAFLILAICVSVVSILLGGTILFLSLFVLVFWFSKFSIAKSTMRKIESILNVKKAHQQ